MRIRYDSEIDLRDTAKLNELLRIMGKEEVIVAAVEAVETAVIEEDSEDFSEVLSEDKGSVIQRLTNNIKGILASEKKSQAETYYGSRKAEFEALVGDIDMKGLFQRKA